MLRVWLSRLEFEMLRTMNITSKKSARVWRVEGVRKTLQLLWNHALPLTSVPKNQPGRALCTALTATSRYCMRRTAVWLRKYVDCAQELFQVKRMWSKVLWMQQNLAFFKFYFYEERNFWTKNLAFVASSVWLRHLSRWKYEGSHKRCGALLMWLLFWKNEFLLEIFVVAQANTI